MRNFSQKLVHYLNTYLFIYKTQPEKDKYDEKMRLVLETVAIFRPYVIESNKNTYFRLLDLLFKKM